MLTVSEFLERRVVPGDAGKRARLRSPSSREGQVSRTPVEEGVTSGVPQRKQRACKRRAGLQIPVRLRGASSDSYVLPGVARDLSVEGLYVHCSRVYPVGSRLKICFQSHVGEVWGEGVVRWISRISPPTQRGHAFGMGLKFTALSAALKAFVQHCES